MNAKQAPVTATVAATWFTAAATNCTAIADALVQATASHKTPSERHGAVLSALAMLTDHIVPMLCMGEDWLKAKDTAFATAPAPKPAPVAKPAPAPVAVAAKAVAAPVAVAPAAKGRVSKAQWVADRAAGLAHWELLKAQCAAASLPTKGNKADLLARLTAAGITPVARPAAKQVDAPVAPAAKPVVKKFTPLAPTPAAVVAAKAAAKPAAPVVAAKTAPATCQAAKGLAAMAVMLGVSLADLQAAAQLTNVTLTVG